MLLTDILEDSIPWRLLHLFLESIDDLPIHKSRKNSIQRAVAARPTSKIATVIDSWFPQNQERLVIPVNTANDNVDYKQQNIDKLAIEIAAEIEGYGFIATPEYLKQNIVYDELTHRPIKLKQVAEIIKAGRIPKPGFQKQYGTYRGGLDFPKHIERQIENYQSELSYVNSDKVGSGTKSIIISRNPTDIATMSTGRPWTSCMDLSNGANASHVAQAIKDGMIVAYLVMGESDQVEKLASDTSQPIDALARIAIKPMRRYMSKVDITNNIPHGIGWPEDRVYHANRADINGFKETVTAWVKEKITETLKGKPDGKYKVTGGYTDSLDDFKVGEHFYDEASVIKQLSNINTNTFPHADTWYRMWEVIKSPIKTILNQPAHTIRKEIRGLAFNALLKAQPEKGNSIDNKKGRHALMPSEIATVSMIRKFPEFLPLIKSQLSPIIRDWIVGHTNESLYDYIDQLLAIIEKALAPKATDYMRELTKHVNNTVNSIPAQHRPNLGLDELLNSHGVADSQTAMRTLSRLKVVLRTFIKEQEILLPERLANAIKQLVAKANAAGLATDGIMELVE